MSVTVFSLLRKCSWLSHYAQKTRGFAAAQIPFLLEDNLQLCNRSFYEPVSSVIGCHWSCAGRKHLRDPFSWFPKRFFHYIPWLKGSKSKIHSVIIYFLSFFLPCMAICVRDREDKLEADFICCQMLDGCYKRTDQAIQYWTTDLRRAS